MSGHKRTTVSISEEEYRRLQDAEMRLRFVKREMPALEETVKRQARVAQLEQEQRHKDYAGLIQKFDRRIKQMEALTVQALTDQQAEFNDLLAQTTDTLQAQDTRQWEQALTERDAVYSAEINRQQEMINTLQQQVMEQTESAGRTAVDTQHWLEAAETVRSFIVRTYSLETDDEETISRLDEAIQMAYLDLSDRRVDTALIYARQAFSGYSRLHSTLELRKAHCQALQTQIHAALLALRRQAEDAAVCPAIGMDGSELDVQINVADWSNGAYQALLDGIDSAVATIENDCSDLGLTELQSYLTHTLPALNQALAEVLFQARLAVLNSQIRINIADLALQALKSQGFTVKDAGYAEDDMQMDYYAAVEGSDGSEVIIQVSPLESGIENDLHIHTLDQNNQTAREMRWRARQISDVLRQRGLQVGPTSQQPAQYSQPLHRQRNQQAALPASRHS